MASYVEKMRQTSRHFFPQNKQKPGAPPTEEAPSVTGPAVTEASEEVGSDPVLDAEDQRFLERLAAIASEPEGTPPPLPQRAAVVSRDAQEALMDGADKVALPTSPSETAADASDKGKGKKSVMSYFQLPKFNKKDKQPRDKKGADHPQAANTAGLTEAQKEDKELTAILDQLNLSAVNNRVFSFSKESEELLNKFTQVLKDLVNGVPTAYNDLEKLFTDYDNQLKKMYGSLPPFLQNLVKSLPAKLTATLGPELMAASSEKPGFDAQPASGGTKSKIKKAMLPQVPSLKSLVSAQGAVATALRSIVNFLKFRFPALATGTNVIMSLAVFVLLFVFWYCHKRGRETRLEKERLAAEESQAGRVSGASSMNGDADSIFASQIKAKEGEKEPPASPPQEPLIISDGREKEEQLATVGDMPSVSHLPDPRAGEVPKTATPPPVGTR